MGSASDDRTRCLVALAKEGDCSALNQLCEVYGERVRRILRLRMDRRIRAKLDSMDVVQDALVLALGGLEGFTYKDEGDFLRWLSTIAENRLRDIFEKFHTDKRDMRREIPLNREKNTESRSAGVADPVGRTTPSVVVSKQEQLDRLEKALDALKPEHREVIVLKKIEGLSYAEIAERLGKSPEAVGMLLSRAMAALTLAYGND